MSGLKEIRVSFVAKFQIGLSWVSPGWDFENQGFPGLSWFEKSFFRACLVEDVRFLAFFFFRVELFRI